MEVLNWKRPSEPPKPALWGRHSWTSPDGTVLTYRLQDLAPYLQQELLQLYQDEYMEDEPLTSSSGVKQDPVSFAEYTALMQGTMEAGVTLVALEESADSRKEPVIAGAMILPVLTKDDTELPEFQGAAFVKVLALVNEMRSRPGCDPLEEGKVPVTMCDLGLWVRRDRRGRGIALAILEALPGVCKALQIPHFSTLFTGDQSQALAARAGFKELTSIEYATYKGADGEIAFPSIKDKCCKIMGFDVDL